MAAFIMDDRVRLSIDLALSAGTVDPQRRQRQDDTARELGMTGAEVDVARGGSSFDALTSIAVALALETRQSAGHEIEVAQRKALKAGISDEVCREIQAFAIRPFDLDE